MNRINVLQVNKLYPPFTGGIEKIVGQLAEGLAERTNTCVLACQPKGRTAVERRNGVKVIRASSFGIFFSMPLSISFLIYFRKLAKKSDIVQLHMPFPLADLALLLSGYKGKVVLWWHSDIVRQKKLMVLFGPLMRWTLRRADRIVVATQGHIDGSAYLPPYSDKCVVIPYGQDVIPSDAEVEEAKERKAEGDAAEGLESGDLAEAVSAADAERDQPATCEDRQGGSGAVSAADAERDSGRSRSAGTTHFLFIGRLVPYKGCRYLIDAMADVPGADLTVIGDGPLKEELVLRASEKGVNDRITFLSGLTDEEVQAELARCDALVLPSVERSEAFGLVQIEAMAWGKPVINTSLPSGVPYVSLHGATGLTVEPSDSSALASAMRELASDPTLREEYGAAARRRVKEYFTEERMLDEVLELYRDLVCGK